MRPRLLDLFCGAGGAAMGYYRAGFDVVGIDIKPQPRYPFPFIQADALAPPVDLSQFAVVHASPPCQHYSDLAMRNGNRHAHPDLIAATRALVRTIGLPYIIENVSGAPLLEPIWLCGTMFSSLRVIRHRGFESNISLFAPSHPRRHPLCYTKDKRKSNYGKGDPYIDYIHVNGGGNAPVAAKLDAMGIDWMSGKEINEAVPPAYTHYLGQQLLKNSS